MIKQLEVNMILTPEELATEFCNMDNSEQAEFFNEIYKIVKTWDTPFCFQLEDIRTSKSLNKYGRRIMREIGEYSAED